MYAVNWMYVVLVSQVTLSGGRQVTPSREHRHSWIRLSGPARHVTPPATPTLLCKHKHSNPHYRTEKSLPGAWSCTVGLKCHSWRSWELSCLLHLHKNTQRDGEWRARCYTLLPGRCNTILKYLLLPSQCDVAIVLWEREILCLWYLRASA